MLIPEKYRGRYDRLAMSHPWMREMRDSEPICGEQGRNADSGTSEGETAPQEPSWWAQAREFGPMRDLMDECAEFERIVDRLTAERDRMQKVIDGYIDQVTDLEGEVDRLTAERDHWQRVASAHADEIQRLKAERAERTQAEQRVLDMWPRFEDGALVMLGDSFLGVDGRVHTLAAVELTESGCSFKQVGPNMTNTSLGCGLYDFSSAVKRPPLLASDGLPIEFGQVLYTDPAKGGDGTAWEVEGIEHGGSHPVCATGADDANSYERRDLKPGWLTHERPDSWGRIADELRCCADIGCSDEELSELADRIEKLAGKGRP